MQEMILKLQNIALILVILSLHGLGWFLLYRFTKRKKYKNAILAGLWISFTGVLGVVGGWFSFHDEPRALFCLGLTLSLLYSCRYILKEVLPKI